MMFDQIKDIAEREKSRKTRQGYIINLIKEYLQNIVLEYIYGSKEINQQLVFTGGTCLRFCFGLPRLSEDLDFDCESTPDHASLAQNLKKHFFDTLRYPDIDFMVKGRERKIYLKFPILERLGLSYNESPLLLLKVEIAQASLENAIIETSMVDKNGLNYFLRRYSMPDLMAGKTHAFLTRLFFKGKENEIDFKGRDMYDLVWYMGKNILPNTRRLSILFARTKFEKMSWLEMLKEIRNRAEKVRKNHLALDLANFIEDPKQLDNFLDNYLNVIYQYCQSQARGRAT